MPAYPADETSQGQSASDGPETPRRELGGLTKVVIHVVTSPVEVAASTDRRPLAELEMRELTTRGDPGLSEHVA